MSSTRGNGRSASLRKPRQASPKSLRSAPDFQGFTGGPISLVTYFQVPGWGFSNGSTDTLLTPVATPGPAAIS